MARKRQKKAPEGAPAWLVTYGDMVTLLLTFFVMLLSMMETKQEQRVMDFLQAIREVFGYTGGQLYLPSEEVALPKNVNEMRLLVMPIQPDNLGYTNDEGPTGKRTLIRTNPQGTHYIPGGRFPFPELSAELPPDQAALVAEYAEKLRGHTSAIEVRGHCSKRPVTGTEFRDHIDLSYQRARAVAAELVAHGIEPERLLIVGAGTNRPVHRLAFDPADAQRNDLVELLQLDQTAIEY